MTDIQKEAENYLLAIRHKGRAVKSLQQEKEALELSASGMSAIRYDKDKVQSSPINRLEIFMTDIIQKSEEIEELLAELDELKTNAYYLIRQIDNTDARTLLELYYICNVHMIEIIERLHVSERTAYYIKEEALERFGELLLNN